MCFQTLVKVGGGGSKLWPPAQTKLEAQVQSAYRIRGWERAAGVPLLGQTATEGRKRKTTDEKSCSTRGIFLKTVEELITINDVRNK